MNTHTHIHLHVYGYLQCTAPGDTFPQYNWHSLYYLRKTHIVFVWMVLPGIVQYERLISLDALTFSCFHVTFHLFNLDNLVKEAGVYHYSHFIDVWTKTQSYFLFLNLSSLLWNDLQSLRTQGLVWDRSRVQTWFCLLSKLFNFFPWFPSLKVMLLDEVLLRLSQCI